MRLDTIMKLNKILLALLTLFISSFSYGQKYEIGPSLGFTNVFGDQDNYQWGNAKLGGGFIYKINKNYRWSYRFSYHYLPTEFNVSYYPDNSSDSPYEPSSYLNELSFGIEFNFFDYQKPHKKTNSTPYLIAQIAAIQYKDNMSVSIPLGIGFKTKLFSNIAIAIETRLNYSFSDDLEGSLKDNIENPPKNLTQNLNNRNDWYMFTGINLMYIFGRQECYTSPM